MKSNLLYSLDLVVMMRRVDELLEKKEFAAARKAEVKVIVVESVLFAVFLVAAFIFLDAKELGPLSGVISASLTFLFYCDYKKMKKIKTAEAEYNANKKANEAAMEHDRPENLLAWIKKVIDERCVLTPVEEGVCVDDLTEIYLKEKAIGDKEGFIPIILQLDSNLIENVEENLHKDYVPIDNDEELSQRMIAEMKESFDEQLPGEWDKFVGNEEEAAGECLDGIDRVDFFWGRFFVARIPSTKASDVFKYVPMGEWNDCPRPDVHQAMAKRWNERYGATPCFISSDTILYHVPTPVDKKDAFNLAMEHTAYCEDNVGQGVGTIWNLAKQLEKSTFWFFWWD